MQDGTNNEHQNLALHFEIAQFKSSKNGEFQENFAPGFHLTVEDGLELV